MKTFEIQLKEERSYLEYLQSKQMSERNIERVEDQAEVVKLLEDTIMKVNDALIVYWD